MARILSLTARFPYPPYRGDTRRALHIISHLASVQEHHLLSFIERDDDVMRWRVAQMGQIAASVRTVVLPQWRSFLNVGLLGYRSLPFQALYYTSREMREQVRQRVEEIKPDVILVHLFRMAPYALDLPAPILVDLTDVISFEVQNALPYMRPPKRWAYALEARRIAAFENLLARRADAVALCSQRDASILRSRVPEAEPVVVPNVVDTGMFSRDGVTYDPDLIVFCGRLDCRHNEEAVLRFARSIFPKVKRRRPQARFHLVGMSPSRRVRRLISAGLVTHESPPAMEDYVRAIQRAAVSVAPLAFAAGTQCKVLEALAAGVPVITTKVSNDGLGGVPGEHLLVEDDDSRFAELVTDVLSKPGVRRTLSVNGRKLVEEAFGMGAVAEPLERAVEQAIGRGRKRLGL